MKDDLALTTEKIRTANSLVTTALNIQSGGTKLGEDVTPLLKAATDYLLSIYSGTK